MRAPGYARAFADALLAEPARKITIPGFDPPLVGMPGIRDDVRIQYRDEKFQRLRRHHEYTFLIGSTDPVDVSIQLYLTDYGHWRLFAYCRKGMLLSINLTLAANGTQEFPLQQRLKSYSRHLSAESRADAMEALSAYLRDGGLSVTPERVLAFGVFDAKQRCFKGTTPRRFMRHFVTAALVKGHFMANKGYSLPGLRRIAQPGTSALDTLLDVAEVDAEEDGVFDPDDEADARERVAASIVRRRGQRDFRRALMAAYKGQCAMSSCDVEDALEAAHIVSYLGPHTDHVQNGLLLRADLHTLFDLGHITIDSSTMTLRISRALRGSAYEELNERILVLPDDAAHYPSKKALDRHRREVGR